jgi:hypothetical protein
LTRIGSELWRRVDAPQTRSRMLALGSRSRSAPSAGSSNWLSVRPWLAGSLAVLLCACSLIRDQTDPTTVSIRGVQPTLEQLNVGATANAQNQFVNELIQTAGLPPDPPLGSHDVNWDLVTRAGVYEIGRQCDQYLDALFRFNREQRAGRQDLAAAAAATGAIMGLSHASAKALAITAAAFGLASSLFDASVNSVLFTIDPSALRNVALQGRKKYLDDLKNNNVKIDTRPDMLIVLQGYLTQCSPAAIEANINNAASGAPSVVSSNPDVAEKSAALAAPSSTVLAPRAPTQPSGPSRASPPPMAPPPRIDRPRDFRPPPPADDPYAALTKEEFTKLRDLFGLGPFQATGTNSQKFRDKVISFQQCRSDKQTGFLTVRQLKSALEDPKCMPTPPATPAAPQPGAPAPQPPGSPAPQPAGPSTPQPQPGGNQQPPPPPTSR